MSDENNDSRRRARSSPARAALRAGIRTYTPFSFEDAPDVDVLRGKSFRSILEMGIGSKASSGLVRQAQQQLAVINKAAMAGNEIASQALWRIVKYWRDHPEVEPRLEFVKTWKACGRPHTALQVLALMQQWQRTFSVDGTEPMSWSRRLVAHVLRQKYEPACAPGGEDGPVPPSTSLPMCALENPQYRGLQRWGEDHLGMLNDAATRGHEPGNQAIWTLVHYWREHPDLQPGMDFEKVWERCGRPYTALRVLALMQQQRRSDGTNAGDGTGENGKR